MNIEGLKGQFTQKSKIYDIHDLVKTALHWHQKHLSTVNHISYMQNYH